MSKLEDQFEITLGAMHDLREAAKGHTVSLPSRLFQIESELEMLWDEYEEEIRGGRS